MKRLFVKGFIYIGFFIPLFLVVFSVSLLKPNFFTYDQYQKKIFEIKDIDVGVYGDSHIKNGIDTRRIAQEKKVSITHFSTNGVPLLYVIRQIEKHIELNPEINIILDVGTNNIETNLYLEGDQYSKVGFLTHMANNYLYLHPQDYFLFFERYPFLTFQGILNGIYQFTVFFNSGINRTSTVLTEEVKTQYDELKASHDSIRRKITRKFSSEFEIQNLYQLIEKHPKTSFLCIRPPEHPLHQSLYSNQLKFDQIKAHLSSMQNVVFLDYGTINFNDSLFSDYSHLNNYGNKIFTSQLLSDEHFISFISN